jgi:hypothetical protein
MSGERDVEQAYIPDGDSAEEPVGGSGLRARARRSLRVPGALIRLLVRDPQHIPERLTIYAVDRRAAGASGWVRMCLYRECRPVGWLVHL